MPRKKTKNLKLFTMKVEENQLEKYRQYAKEKNRPLATIIKSLLDNEPLPSKTNFKKEPIRTYNDVNHELIRQLSAIGNNLNQIARRVNQEEKFDVIPHLVSIENQLEKLLDAH